MLWIFHALIGYCGTMPSVEFYEWLRGLKIVLPYKDPMDNPIALGNGTPEPDRFLKVGAGLVGGLLGYVVATNVLPENPAYTIGSAYIGGRVLSDAVSVIRSFMPRKQVGK